MSRWVWRDGLPRFARYGCALYVLVFLLTACKFDTGGAQPDATGPAPPPAVEKTGPERPAPGGNDMPSVDLPQLPYGLNGDKGTFTPRHARCVPIKWLGPTDADLPSGATLEIIGIGFDPRGVVTLDSQQRCFGPCLHFSFRSVSKGNCQVPLVADKNANANHQETDLILSGVLKCPAAKRPACLTFEARIDRNRTSLHLIVEFPEPTPQDSS